MINFYPKKKKKYISEIRGTVKFFDSNSFELSKKTKEEKWNKIVKRFKDYLNKL